MKYLVLIKNYIKNNLITIFIVLLIISLGLNLYQLFLKPNVVNTPVVQKEETIINESDKDKKDGEIVFSAPYGFRNEIVTTFNGKEARTYSTSTALTKEDVEKMNKEILERQRRIDEYFRNQERMFRDFWRMF